MTILNEDRHWPVLTRCIGREDLLADARFATKPDRLANAADLIAILDEAFGARDRPEWVGILRDNGIVFDIVAMPQDIPNDEQIKANGLGVCFPESPELSAVDSPFTIRGVEKVAPRLPPSIGQHTDEVLREIGYDEPAIARLRAEGTVA